MGKKVGAFFSWGRAFSILSTQARTAGAAGMLPAREGRQRRFGAATECLMTVVCLTGLLFLCSCGKSREPNFGLLQEKLVEARLTHKNTKPDYYPNKIAEAKKKFEKEKAAYKDDPDLLKSVEENHKFMLEFYQKAEQVRRNVLLETREQTRKAAFLMVHLRYAALQDPEARKDFMKMIDDPELFKGRGAKSVLAAKYPAYMKEVKSEEYTQRANQLMKDLKLKMFCSALTYDQVSDLEKAYDIVKKLY